MNTITITVKSVNIIKTGVKKDGMPYMFLNVVDENDKKYGTFDEEYLKAVGKTITINYEEKFTGSNPKNGGKPYKNLVIVDSKKLQGSEPSATQAWAEKLVAAVKDLAVRVKKLEDNYEVVEEEERPPLDDEEEIRPEDIPF